MFNLPNVFYFFVFILCLTTFVGPVMSLTLGIMYSWFIGNPSETFIDNASKWLLKLSVIGLGFNINIHDVIAVGKSSFLITIVSITAIIGLGEVLRQFFRINKNTGILISFGTAICGGSAIAAMAPVIKAKQNEIAMSLGIVFLLNAIGLLIFPPLGHYFELTDKQFAIWAALAIHDTSSVVAAAAAFSPLAIGIATTIKLTRAMWIIPYTILAGTLLKTDERISVPLFIFGFIIAAMLNTYYPQHIFMWEGLYLGAKQLLVATLFLIGTCISKENILMAGFKPLIMAVILWAIVSSSLLALILEGIIQ
jgi:uncharacterized integral membrane protein (TIGR00698 family)